MAKIVKSYFMINPRHGWGELLIYGTSYVIIPTTTSYTTQRRMGRRNIAIVGQLAIFYDAIIFEQEQGEVNGCRYRDKGQKKGG